MQSAAWTLSLLTATASAGSWQTPALRRGASRPTGMLRSQIGTSAELSNRVDRQMQQCGRRQSRVSAATLGVFAFGILMATGAKAQGIYVDPWDDNGYVSINYGYHVGNWSFQDSLSAAIYDEEATYSIKHAGSGGGHFDVGLGLRVWRNLAVGVGVTVYSNPGGASVSGSVPHPLFYNRPRSASFARTDLEHKEVGVHFQAVWVMPVTERIKVSVGGGPSIWSVAQSLITSVTPAEIGAPWDEVAISSAAAASTASYSGVGGNAGVDMTYMVTDRLGAGIFARWTGGSVRVPASGGAQSLDVGGFQSGIGLRATF